MKKLWDTLHIHLVFEISLIFKGLFAVAEIATGLLAYFITRNYLLSLVRAITQTELSEDPRDFLANHLLHAAQHLSISSRNFTAFYLVGHGVVKLWLVIGLWREKMSYYPAAIIVFSLFILYQMYRYSFTQSPLLLLITLVDGIVIWLTTIEYRQMRRVLSGNHA